MPPILDVAIGTVFIFLLFSLVVSALNELLLSYFDQRAKFLHMGVQELFGETARGWRQGFCLKLSGGLGSRIQVGTWTRQLYQHGLINSLSRSDSPDDAEGRSPSYIPAGVFVTALLDLIGKNSTAPTTAPDIAAQANVLTGFLTAIQAARTNPPADYPTALGVFTTSYGLLPTKPTDGSPLATLNDRVALDVLKPQAALDLLALTDLADSTLVIQRLPLPLQKELNALLADSAGQLSRFQTAVREWYDPARQLSALEAAAASALAPLLCPTVTQTAQVLENHLRALPSGKLKESLLSLFAAAGRDVHTFKTAVEGWFNASMDRVSGWYKRFAQTWMIVISFTLAAILNVDTIRIVQELSRNPNLAKAVALQAESHTRGTSGPTWDERKREIEAAVRAEQNALDTAIATENAAALTNPLDTAALEAARSARKAAEQQLKQKKEPLLAVAGSATSAAFHDSIEALKTTGIPLGWEDSKQREALGLSRIAKLGTLKEAGVPPGFIPALTSEKFWAWFSYYPYVYTANFFDNFWAFLPLLIGWFLTALAASLGAPFWFDTLGRFVSIRNAGRPPGEKDPTVNATRPPPATLDKAIR